MADHALAELTVLDLSLDVGGAYCTKLLADLGADVIMVEPPGGHPLRSVGPFAEGNPHSEKSGLFLHFGANKRSMVLDLDTSGDLRAASELARGVDLVVESFQPGHLDSLGLGYEALKTANPRAVMTSVTHFGQTGPYKDWKGEEIVDYAVGGYLYFGGHPQREPLMVPDNQAQMHAGLQAAIGSMAAVRWARRSGRGQHVDISAVEAMLSAHAWTAISWTHMGQVIRRTDPDCIPCKDGWVFIMGLRWNPDLLVMVERPDLLDDPRFADRESWAANMELLWEVVRDWCLEHTKDQIFHAGQELLIPVTPVNTAEDLLKSPQLQARRWFVDVDHPVAGRQTLPGFPYNFAETQASIQRPAPTLDQDAGYRPAPSSNGHRGEPERALMDPAAWDGLDLPLKGVRVLEVTANWAGPMTSRHLADLGAEVIKVEPPDRLMSRKDHNAGDQGFRYYYNRSGYFAKLNRNKHSLTLNLNTARGRELFLRMLKDADVFIENNSPRVMRNLDLEYPVIREANPDIIMLSISGFGHNGPQRDYIAYGANIEASSGLAAVTGYPDDERPYRTTMFYADPITAGHAAFAVLAALNYRARIGKGQHIEMALQENGMLFFPESLLEYSMTGNLAPRRGNRHSRYAPRGVYPSIGDDMWLALAVRSDEERRRFCGAAGEQEWVQRFPTEERRRENHDEVDRLVAKWSSQYDHNEAARILQSAGIPAGPVLTAWEMLSNQHIFERGFYVPIVHKEMGVFPYPGMPWKLSETPALVRMAAPCFAEHNALVFKKLLKLGDGEIDELYRQRVTADEPPEGA